MLCIEGKTSSAKMLLNSSLRDGRNSDLGMSIPIVSVELTDTSTVGNISHSAEELVLYVLFPCYDTVLLVLFLGSTLR